MLSRPDVHDSEASALPIRRGVPSDAAALAAFAARTFKETFGDANDAAHLAEHLVTAYGTVQQGRELADPDCITLLVDAGSQLAGYAQIRRHSPPPCVVGPAPVELARFYVDRPWHGLGLAQRLMAAAGRAAAELAGRTLWLGVWEHNPRAIAFYTKIGFRDTGATKFCVGSDQQTDRVLVADVSGLLREDPSP